MHVNNERGSQGGIAPVRNRNYVLGRKLRRNFQKPNNMLLDTRKFNATLISEITFIKRFKSDILTLRAHLESF